MEYKYEIIECEENWYRIEMTGIENEEKHTFCRFCETLEEAQEYIKTHDMEKEIRKRIANYKQAIKEEDEIDDGKLHPIGFGFEERAGNMIEYEEF